MKLKKIMITEKIGEIDAMSDLSGSFDKVIDKLQKYKQLYHSKHTPQKGEEIYIGYHSFYDEGSFTVYLKRYETDIEYSIRLNREKVTQTKIKNKELQEYERLKKKYGTKQ